MKRKLQITAIVLLAFCVYMAFFDQHNWRLQSNRKSELEDITNRIQFLTKESEMMENELNGLQHNAYIVEKNAREKYFHKRDGEDIYIIKTNSDSLIEKKVQ